MASRSKLLVFLLAAPALLAADHVAFRQEPGKVHVLVDNKPFTTLHYGKELDKVFLHPVRAASGVAVTRGWPVDPVPGETTDHPHHRGLWWAQGATNGVDFWTNGPGTGRYVLKADPKLDPERGAIRVEMDMTAPSGRVLGSLHEEYVFSAAGQNRMIDVWIQILADRDQEIRLGDTKEGDLGFRVADELTEPKGAALVNSEGGKGERQIWGKRARWVDSSGRVGGAVAGVAMFDHPSNPAFPTYWMARGYGLLAANATGLREFSGDNTLDGSITIPKGGQLGFRYRVVIHPGDAASAKVDTLWQEYSRVK